MIKKILFIIVFLSIIISCGKKGDPVFKESKLNLSNTKLIMVLWDTNQKNFLSMDLMLIK